MKHEQDYEFPIHSECISVVSVPGGRYSYCAAALYRAVLKENKTGAYWCKVQQIGKDYRSPFRARQFAAEAAAERGCMFLGYVRHGAKIRSVQEVAADCLENVQ